MAVGEPLTLLIVKYGVWEIQVAERVVRSLGRLGQRSHLLLGLLLVLVREVSRALPVCVGHFTNRTGGDRGLCFEVCFFCWVRIKLGRAIKGQRVKKKLRL